MGLRGCSCGRRWYHPSSIKRKRRNERNNMRSKRKVAFVVTRIRLASQQLVRVIWDGVSSPFVDCGFALAMTRTENHYGIIGPKWQRRPAVLRLWFRRSRARRRRKDILPKEKGQSVLAHHANGMSTLRTFYGAVIHGPRTSMERLQQDLDTRRSPKRESSLDKIPPGTGILLEAGLLRSEDIPIP